MVHKEYGVNDEVEAMIKEQVTNDQKVNLGSGAAAAAPAKVDAAEDAGVKPGVSKPTEGAAAATDLTTESTTTAAPTTTATTVPTAAKDKVAGEVPVPTKAPDSRSRRAHLDGVCGAHVQGGLWGPLARGSVGPTCKGVCGDHL